MGVGGPERNGAWSRRRLGGVLAGGGAEPYLRGAAAG